MKKKVSVVCKDGIVEMMMEENEIGSLLDKIKGDETEWETIEKYRKIKDIENEKTSRLKSIIETLKDINKKFGDDIEMYSDYKGDDIFTVSFYYPGLNDDYGKVLEDEYKEWHKRKCKEVVKKYGLEDAN